MSHTETTIERCHFCGFESAHVNGGGTHFYARTAAGDWVSYCWTRECPRPADAVFTHCDQDWIGQTCQDCGEIAARV